MPLPTDALPTTCDIFRPFGAGPAIAGNVPCRLAADYVRSRELPTGPVWTHYLILDATIDIRDGCTRAVGANTIAYADGDEVRVPSGASSPRFVVVWVETVDPNTPRAFKRAFLMRHTP